MEALKKSLKLLSALKLFSCLPVWQTVKYVGDHFVFSEQHLSNQTSCPDDRCLCRQRKENLKKRKLSEKETVKKL